MGAPISLRLLLLHFDCTAHAQRLPQSIRFHSIFFRIQTTKPEIACIRPESGIQETRTVKHRYNEHPYNESRDMTNVSPAPDSLVTSRFYYIPSTRTSCPSRVSHRSRRVGQKKGERKERKKEERRLMRFMDGERKCAVWASRTFIHRTTDASSAIGSLPSCRANTGSRSGWYESPPPPYPPLMPPPDVATPLQLRKRTRRSSPLVVGIAPGR